MSQPQETLSQSFETLLIERRDRVAIITINRPEKRNALNIQTREEGAAALDELREAHRAASSSSRALAIRPSSRAQISRSLPGGQLSRSAMSCSGARSLQP